VAGENCTLAPLRIAVSERLPDDACEALRIGLVDTAGCSLDQLRKTAAALAFWDGALPPDATTTVFAKTVLLPWSPASHWRYHPGFREAITTLLRVHQRLDTGLIPAAAAPMVALASSPALTPALLTPATARRSTFASGVTGSPSSQAALCLSRLPRLVWALIASFLLRRDFVVPVKYPAVRPGMGT